MRLIDEYYTRYPFYGVRRLTEWLRNEGHKKYPYLLKGLIIGYPNHVWCADYNVQHL